MIQEAYCTYNTAMALQSKGFDEPTEYFITPDGIRTGCDNMREPHKTMRNSDIIKSTPDRASCPTHQMALAWLREHKFFALVEDCLDTKFFRGHIHICKNDTDVRIATKLRVSYEEATEDIINACLKLMV